MRAVVTMASCKAILYIDVFDTCSDEYAGTKLGDKFKSREFLWLRIRRFTDLLCIQEYQLEHLSRIVTFLRNFVSQTNNYVLLGAYLACAVVLFD